MDVLKINDDDDDDDDLAWGMGSSHILGLHLGLDISQFTLLIHSHPTQSTLTMHE